MKRLLLFIISPMLISHATHAAQGAPNSDYLSRSLQKIIKMDKSHWKSQLKHCNALFQQLLAHDCKFLEAAENGDIDNMDWALSSRIDKANINVNNRYGYTALHLASASLFGELSPIVVLFLIKSGADVNAQTQCEMLTPLHLAELSENKKIAKLLLLHGADETIKSFDGKTPLYLSRTSPSLPRESTKIKVIHTAKVEDKSGEENAFFRNLLGSFFDLRLNKTKNNDLPS